MITKLISHLQNHLNMQIYPNIAPKEARTPFCVYTIINQSERISINLGSYQSDFMIQLDIYTNSFKQAHNLASKTKEALFQFDRPITALSSNISFENELYRAMIEFDTFI